MELTENTKQTATNLAGKRKPKGFFQILLSRTTISALVQIHLSAHTATKVIWCVLFFLGLSISVYQSYALITAYLRFSINEKESVVLKVPLPLPAVTICSNTLIDWESDHVQEALNISGLLEDMNVTSFDDLDITQSQDGHDRLMLKMATFNESQRIDFGTDFKHFLIAGEYGDGTTSFEDIMKIESNNLFYGNCLTVDANRYHNHSLNVQSESGYYTFAVLVQNIAGFTSLIRDKSIVATIHESGTPAIMKLESTFKVYSGEFLEIKVAQKEITRLPWPYASECVQADHPAAQWQSLYYSEETPFLYTMEACRDSCLQNLSLTYCNCIHPMLGIRGELHQLKKFCIYGCNQIPADEVVRMCGCRDSCKHLEFTFQEKRNPNALTENTVKEKFLKFLLADIPEDKKSLMKEILKNLVIFTVSTSSNFARLMTEEAAITAADLGGAIGGVFGLWIGLSAMSLLEVFAVTQAAVLSYVKFSWLHSGTNKSNEQNPPKRNSEINSGFDGHNDDLAAAFKHTSEEQNLKKPYVDNTRL